MYQNSIDLIDFSPEFVFKSSRSGGAGGQNVNKVNTKVELRFSVNTSSLLDEDTKVILLEKLYNKLNNEGELIIVSQSERTQLGNKQKCIEKFYRIIKIALTKQKKRNPTKPTLASKIKRVTDKRIKSEKKNLRKRNIDNERN